MDQEPRSLPRQDLSSVFQPSSTSARAAGIPRVERPAARTVHTPQELSTPSAVPDSASPNDAPIEPMPPAPQAPAPAPSPASKPEAPKAAEDGKVNYQVQLEAGVRRLLKQERDKTGLTMATIILDAIDQLIDMDAPDPLEHLRELVRADLGLDVKPKSLFTREPERAAATIEDLGDRQPQLIRLTPDNKAQLQSLVTQVGAVDRGHLVSVALRSHFKITQGTQHGKA